MREALQLITGPLGALEGALARDIQAAKRDDPLAPVTVLIGGTLLRPYLQRRLAELTGGIANVSFLTPSELALALGERGQTAAGRRPLPPLADRILLRDIAGGIDGYFAPVRDTPGFAEALHRLVRELRAAGHDADSFRAAVRDACEVPEKEEALASIVQEFLDRRRDFYGADDCLLGADPDALDADRLLVYGLWDAPAALRGVLERIAGGIPVTVYLPRSGTDADHAHAEMRAWLAGVGAVESPAAGELGSGGTANEVDRPAAPQEQLSLDAPEPEAEGSAEPPEPEHTPGSGLDHLGRHLFAPNGAGPLDGSVNLLSGPDPTRELREVARACLGWAREGIAFHEMAVVYRHPEPYRALIESVFGEAGVPLYMHEGTPLIERPVGRRVAALLELAGSDLERREVMEFLTDAHLPEETRAAYGNAPASRWDKLSREAGVVAGLDEWRDRLARRRAELLGDDGGGAKEERSELLGQDVRERPAGDGADTSPEEDERRTSVPDWVRDDAERAAALARFVEDLAVALEDHPERGTWADHVAWLRRLLDRYVHDPSPVLDALEGVERFDALSPEVTFERFREVVRGALETLRSADVLGERRGAFARRGVNVLDANSIRHLRFRAVAVVGLAERRFPPPPRPDPLLLEDERQRLNERAAAPIPLRVRRPDTEPLQFSMAVAATSDRLLLTYPRKSGEESRPQLPSAFLRAAATAMVGRTVRASEVDSLPGELYTRAPGSRIGADSPEVALSASERDRTLLERHPGPARAALAQAEPAVERSLAAREARFARALTPYDGALDEDALDELAQILDPAGPHSPTGLESYATCPQRFFLSSVARMKPVEEPEATHRLSALDFGSLVHRMLERFLAEAPEDGTAVTGPAEPDRLRRIAAEECERAEQRGETGYALIWRYDRDELLEDLIAWLETERQDAESRGLSGAAFEVGFGFGGEHEGPLSSDKPIEVTAEGARLEVRGKIDRLHWDRERRCFRVIDYKTGRARKELTTADFGGGTRLQLPLYLLAAAGLTGIDVEHGSAAYHFVTRRGGYERVSFEGEELERRRGDFERLVGGLVRGMGGGSFHMAPPEERACRWCDFDGLCPTDRWSRIERKQGDARAQALLELREIK